MSERFESTLDSISTDMSEKGWSHIATGLDPYDEAAIKALFRAMSGRMTQDQRYIPEISTISPEEKARSLAASSEAMSFHTDNVYLTDPCRSVALFCTEQAEEGGVNELIDGLATARSLPTDVQEVLERRQWQWGDPRTQAASPKLPVLEEESIRWWRASLVTRDMGLMAVADVFEKAIEGADRSHVLLQPGEMLVTDNRRTLHSRSAFEGQRLLYRARFW